jgi:phosphohistidine swiveling domain-containing protein
VVAKVVVPLLAESLAFHGLLARSGVLAACESRVVQGRLYLDSGALRHPLLRLLDGASLGGGPLLKARLLDKLLRLETLAGDCCAVLQRLTQELEREPIAAWDDDDLRALLRLRPHPGFREELIAMPPAGLLAQLCGPAVFARLTAMVRGWAGEPAETAGTLTSGMHGMVDVECASALWDLADEARSIPKLRGLLSGPPPRVARLERLSKAGDFRSGLQALLNRFGDRGPGENELMRPRWRDDPEPLLSAIAGYLGLPPEASPHVAEWRQHWKREAALERVRRRLRLRPMRRLAFELALRIAQRSNIAAANVQFEAAGLYATLRRAALELGARLARGGALDRAEDAFFLTLDELERPGSAPPRDVVAARRAQHARDCEVEPAPCVDAEARPLELRALPVEGAGALRGIPASPGRARGRVVVLSDSAPLAVQAGAVLVVAHADPAWTPLFAVAAALVVENGGPASPALLIARELGIPSVVDVVGATLRLRPGETVEVDGGEGTVSRLEGRDAVSGEAA